MIVQAYKKRERDIHELKRDLNDKIKHPYLMKFISEPVVDVDKLHFLYNMYRDTSFTLKESRSYIIPTMLVQVALDTHEAVQTGTVKSSRDKTRNRQLTVLAGDYYSGLYYHLLAQMSDISMISRLAGAIKEMNEAKILLYRRDASTIRDLLAGVRAIEARLLQNTAEFLGLPGMKEAAGEFFFIKRAQQERELLAGRSFSPFFAALSSILGMSELDEQTTSEQAELVGITGHLIEDSKERLLSALPAEGELVHYVQNRLVELEAGLEKVAEEG